jgi:cytoskeletal protein RodZ
MSLLRGRIRLSTALMLLFFAVVLTTYLLVRPVPPNVAQKPKATTPTTVSTPPPSPSRRSKSPSPRPSVTTVRPSPSPTHSDDAAPGPSTGPSTGTTSAPDVPDSSD